MSSTTVHPRLNYALLFDKESDLCEAPSDIRMRPVRPEDALDQSEENKMRAGIRRTVPIFGPFLIQFGRPLIQLKFNRAAERVS